MVAVAKKYVKKGDLISTIDSFLADYENLRVEFPSNLPSFFLVKAWGRKK